MNTQYILLGMALVFFGVSITLDLFEMFEIPFLGRLLFEDSAKLVGIVSWLSYFFRVGVFAVYRNADQQGAAQLTTDRQDYLGCVSLPAPHASPSPTAAAMQESVGAGSTGPLRRREPDCREVEILFRRC